MLNVTELLSAKVAERLGSNHAMLFGPLDEGHLQTAVNCAYTALAKIGTSDALYHNVEHTVHVTLVGIQILLGKQIMYADVSRSDWLNMVVSLLCHDIGYVRGICGNDGADCLATGVNNQTTWIAAGVSDAALMPLHVDRGKRYVLEQFGANAALIDAERVQAGIERTRFPVPDDPSYQQTGDYPGLIRGADLIGQLSDPRYLNKLVAVFFEFEEIGFNNNTGYRKPGDLLKAYPAFFECNVTPYIADAVVYLEQTQEGREVIARLYGNLEQARLQHQVRVVANHG